MKTLIENEILLQCLAPKVCTKWTLRHLIEDQEVPQVLYIIYTLKKKKKSASSEVTASTTYFNQVVATGLDID